MIVETANFQLYSATLNFGKSTFMNINATQSAMNLISHAQHKTQEAAHDIATQLVDKDEVGSTSEFASDELFKPLVRLKEAEVETKAAVKVIQTDDNMKKSLIDAFA